MFPNSQTSTLNQIDEFAVFSSRYLVKDFSYLRLTVKKTVNQHFSIFVFVMFSIARMEAFTHLFSLKLQIFDIIDL